MMFSPGFPQGIRPLGVGGIRPPEWAEGARPPKPQQPYRCPVCEGTGSVRPGFYSTPPPEPRRADCCRSCSGSGVVWEPLWHTRLPDDNTARQKPSETPNDYKTARRKLRELIAEQLLRCHTITPGRPVLDSAFGADGVIRMVEDFVVKYRHAYGLFSKDDALERP